jgi:hypothetical protein
MIDPFKISLDIRDRGWVSEAEPHPHKFDEFNGSFFIWTILSPDYLSFTGKLSISFDSKVLYLLDTCKFVKYY